MSAQGMVHAENDAQGGFAMAKQHEGSKEQGSGAESGRCGCCQPSDEETAKRAYELWLAGGATSGHDVDDWLEAEDELRRARRRQRHTAVA
jgi:hypothetical protein